jgi:hypothetical protein
VTARGNAAAPGSNTEGSKANEAGRPLPIVRGAASWDEWAAHIDGTFVVVVKVAGGKYRRRCFLTFKAAEDAARRAQLRGENAVVLLAELRPLYRVTGGAE